MGVHSLWKIVGPTARPVRLEALSKKKLAIDASIWIYQFLKAMRDKDGNSLPSSHIIGFFRRICKLLYFGILPIFVFDGGVPALKKQTINNRKQRREKNSESRQETAQKLLAIQLQREAENALNRLKKPSNNTTNGDDDDVIYFEDLPINKQERESSTPSSIVYRKNDEYHLPDLKEFKVSKFDERIMPEEDLTEFYEDFDHVDGININEIDPKSKEFEALPIATQYMILSHLRLKSRLRMGYRKEQLEELFPNSMDFSKFQIQQVQRRNFYTQKLMDVTGMGADATISKRLAGDKDRKYALVKNEDGWTLALEGNSEDNPIQVDSDEAEDITREVNSYKEDLRKDKKDEDSDSDFEDVPLEEIPETEEDKDYQRALIKSIYEQYNTQENMQAPTSTINGVDDDELRKAVEKSKVDYFELQAKETQQLEEEKFDFGSSMLFSTNAVKEEALQNSEEISNLTEHAHTQANTVHLSEQNKITNSDTKKELPNSIGQSFLFNADPHRTGKIELRTKEETIFEPEESDFEEAKTNNDQLISHIEKTKKQEPTKDQQKLPDWFQSEVNKTLNPHNVKFVNYNDYQIRNQKNQEEKDAGLVPWYEAKEILEQEQSDEEEQEQEQEKPDNDSDEIEEISKEQVNISISEEKESVPPLSVEDIRKPAVMDYQFEEEDEEELVQQLQKEELDHESLKHQIKASHAIPLTSLETRITDEQLLQEKFQKAKRDSDEVTETMINDVQELLKRFGIPYITAPMEAEAQCAELYKIGLVDGIVTDDSDCFLFGGDKIYKNMFDQKQYVEFYLQDDLFNKMALTQHKLIELALLLGSDYTEGIKGIGRVQAMEILAEFGNLEKFKEWFDKHTKSVADKTELTKLQKSLLDRIKKGKLYLPDSFPDKVVEQAYMSPEVDSDKTEFQWGVPDLDQIRSFLMYNLSWTQTEVDEVMVPLVQDMNKKKLEGRQSTISEFFPQEYIQSRKELNLGKRLKTAANKLKKQKHL